MTATEARVNPGPDAALVEQLRARDEHGAEELVTRYAGLVYRVAFRLTGSPQEAEEVTWEVVETVWEKISTFRGDSALSSWIYRIAVNAAYAKLRGRSRTLPFDDARSHSDHVDEPSHQGGTSHDWSALFEDPAVQAELREVLERGLAELSAEYRTVLVLRDIEGLSNAEVAEVLGLGLAAVKSRVHRARLMLRARLAQHFEKGSAA